MATCLVFASLLFHVGTVDSDLLVVLLEGRKILTSLGEFAFLHTLSDVPVDEGTLGVEEIELVVKARPSVGDGGGVGEHAETARDLCEVTAGHQCGRLVANTKLEASWAPVDELNSTLGLDGGNGGLDILGDDISTVEQAASHVLALTRISLDHLVSGLEAGEGHLRNRVLFVVSLVSRQEWRVGGQREVDTRERNKVGLELVQVDVEGTIEAERGGNARDDLGDQPVQVDKRRGRNVELATADVVDSLVVNHERAVRVLKGRVGREDRVVGLDDRAAHLGSGVDAKLELGLFAIVRREALHEESTKAGAGSTAKRVEDKEALKTRAVVGEPPQLLDADINDLLSDSVVTTSVVVRGVLLAGHERLRMEKGTVGASLDLVNDIGLQIDVKRAGNVFSGSSLREEGREASVCLGRRIGCETAIWAQAVFDGVKLPASVTNLDTSLSDVDRDDFTHYRFVLVDAAGPKF